MKNKLTGKCKTDFLNYYWETKLKPLKMTICKRSDLEEFFDTFSEIFQNALIIDFFDSVGIYVNVLKYNDKWKIIVENQFRWQFDTRQEATNKAIEKANETYNMLKKC